MRSRILLIGVLLNAASAFAQSESFVPLPEFADPGAILRIRVVARNAKPPNADDKTEHQDFCSKDVLEVNAGTAYLIETKLGYAITAEHVIHDAANDSATNLIVATTTALPDRCLELTVVKPIAEDDLALLKVVDPSGLDEIITPLDISLRMPQAGNLSYFGYPKTYIDEPNKELSAKNAHVEGLVDSPIGKLIKTTATVFVGQSGGPLVNSFGAVVGTNTDKEGVAQNGVAYFVPSSRAAQLLDLLPLSKRMSDLDKELEKNAISKKQLNVLLHKQAKHPTNVDLYEWINKSKPSETVSKLIDFLPSPVIIALWHRELDDVAEQISEALGAHRASKIGMEGAKAALNVAKREEILQKEIPLGIRAATLAIDVFKNLTEHSFQERPLVAEALLARGNLYSTQGLLVRSRQDLNEADRIALHEGHNTLRAKIDSAKGDLHVKEANIAGAKGDVHAKQSEVQAAVSDYFYSVMAAPEDVGLIYDNLEKLTNFSLQVRSYDAAEDALGKIAEYFGTIENRDVQAEASYRLGQIEVAADKKAAAKGHLLDSLKLEPNWRHARDAQALIQKIAPK
jgi:S1-C subfamily serine protease